MKKLLVIIFCFLVVYGFVFADGSQVSSDKIRGTKATQEFILDLKGDDGSTEGAASYKFGFSSAGLSIIEGEKRNVPAPISDNKLKIVEGAGNAEFHIYWIIDSAMKYSLNLVADGPFTATDSTDTSTHYIRYQIKKDDSKVLGQDTFTGDYTEVTDETAYTKAYPVTSQDAGIFTSNIKSEQFTMVTEPLNEKKGLSYTTNLTLTLSAD